MAKAGSGDGSIVNRGRNRWQVFVSYGKNPITGKYERVSRTVHGSKADARRVRDELIAQRNGGLKAEAGKITFGEFAKQWLAVRLADPDLAKRTKQDNEKQVKILLEYLSEVRLCDITPQTVEALYRQVQQDRGVSSTTLHKLHVALKQILGKAVDYDMLIRNPCDRVKAPKLNKVSRRSLSQFDVLRLSRALEQSETDETGTAAASCVVAVRLGLATGMRLSEILALQWRDIDLDTDIITVNKSLDMDVTLKTPKSASGYRTLAIDAATSSVLARWKLRQAGMMSELGIRQAPDDPVCCSGAFGYIDQANFQRWWRAWRDKNGFQGLKFHELRHTQATQLIAAGADIKTVQNRLGHTSAALTLDMYAHPTIENDKKAAALFGHLMTGRRNDLQGPSKEVTKTA